MKKTRIDWLLFIACALSVAFVMILLAAILFPILMMGLPVLSPSFLIEKPASDMLGGGIGPAIYGTVILTFLMTLAGVPVGVATAIYLSEYAPRKSWLARWIRAAIHNLAGVPSIVFGLFGLGFFVLFVGSTLDGWFVNGPNPVWGKPSILWAALTLSILTLPVVIVTTEEALRSVPRELREASLGLGATTFQTIFRVVLPNAKAGILTGVILAVSRGAGEVAPILFTGVANYLPQLPTDVRDMFMHLGYHVYVLATQSPNVDQTAPVLYATVLVLLFLTFCLNLVAIWIRSRSRA